MRLKRPFHIREDNDFLINCNSISIMSVCVNCEELKCAVAQQLNEKENDTLLNLFLY